MNCRQKSDKDFSEWRPALNQCWFADTIIKVKSKYRLTVDSREKAVLENTLRPCTSVSIIFSGAARSSQQTSTRQQAQNRNNSPLAIRVNSPAAIGGNGIPMATVASPAPKRERRDLAYRCAGGIRPIRTCARQTAMSKSANRRLG